MGSFRSQIMQLSKTKTTIPATVHNVKRCAPEIPAFKKSLKSAKFNTPATVTTADSTDEASSDTSQLTGIDELNKKKVHLHILDLCWFWKLMDGNTLFYAWFMSKYIEDPLHQFVTWIQYPDCRRIMTS